MRGFTLIEVMVMLAIAAIVGILLLNGIKEKREELGRSTRPAVADCK